MTEQAVSGRVTFGEFWIGGNGAVHGGALPLLFDDVLGRLAIHATGPGGPISRTAYLKVNFRKVTPLEQETSFRGVIDRVEGRKRFASGQLHSLDGELLADAEGLFVELRAGQP